MSFFAMLSQRTSDPIFFLRMSFWYGAFIVLGVGTAAQALWAKRVKIWWTKRRNLSWFILGRIGVPGIPGSDIRPASERLGNVERDLKEQHKDIKDQGVDIQEIKGLLVEVNKKLGTALSISANTNLKVTANGGNTDSAPDVLQRMARKMGVWEHNGQPPISVANIVDLHDFLSAIHTEDEEVIAAYENRHETTSDAEDTAPKA